MYENLLLLLINNINYTEYGSIFLLFFLKKTIYLIKNFFISVLTEVFLIKILLLLVNNFTNKINYLMDVDFTQIFNPFLQINHLNYLFYIQQMIDVFKNNGICTITSIINQVFKNPIFFHIDEYINDKNKSPSKIEKPKLAVIILFIIYSQLYEIINSKIIEFNLLIMLVNFIILIYSPIWTVYFIVSNTIIDKIFHLIQNAI